MRVNYATASQNDMGCNPTAITRLKELIWLFLRGVRGTPRRTETNCSKWNRIP